MLKADCRYHGALRTVDGIRAVKRTAETDLKHNDVALLLKKIEHRYRGDKLELAWVIRHALGYRLHALRKLREPVIRNLDAVYLHPLVEAADIRRGVELAVLYPAFCMTDASIAQVEPLPFVPRRG